MYWRSNRAAPAAPDDADQDTAVLAMDMTTVPLAFAIFAGLMLLVLSSAVRRATAWGLVVGPIFALWIIGPELLHLHRLYPESVWQWFLVQGFLVLTFIVF